MNTETAFSFINTLALGGWILMIFAPRWRWTLRIVVSVVVSILAAFYIYTISGAINPELFSSFSTLQGVKSLFAQEEAVLAGWAHYLAFDLMTGRFILKDAQENDIHHAFVVPALLFTFMLGPVGLLFYLVIRFVKTKQYFLD